MNKVYIVTVEAMMDYVPSSELKVFVNHKEAYEEFKKQIDLAIIDTDGQEFIVEEGKDYWEVFEDGDFPRNHITVKLLEEALQ